MNTKEKIEIMQAFLDGEKIEVFCNGGWVWELVMAEPNWNWEVNYYRIKPKVKPSINWDEVTKHYNYLVQQPFGGCYLFKSKPYIKSISWGNEQEKCGLQIKSHSSLNLGDCDWKESLVCRPGFEEE